MLQKFIPFSRGPGCVALMCALRVQAKEFGEAEVWMNERLMRASKRKFAEFLTAFEEEAPGGGSGPLWLLWQYEGDCTLADLMAVRRLCMAWAVEQAYQQWPY